MDHCSLGKRTKTSVSRMSHKCTATVTASTTTHKPLYAPNTIDHLLCMYTASKRRCSDVGKHTYRPRGWRRIQPEANIARTETLNDVNGRLTTDV
jgi:hypothetical protein